MRKSRAQHRIRSIAIAPIRFTDVPMGVPDDERRRQRVRRMSLSLYSLIIYVLLLAAHAQHHPQHNKHFLLMLAFPNSNYYIAQQQLYSDILPDCVSRHHRRQTITSHSSSSGSDEKKTTPDNPYADAERIARSITLLFNHIYLNKLTSFPWRTYITRHSSNEMNSLSRLFISLVILFVAAQDFRGCSFGLLYIQSE